MDHRYQYVTEEALAEMTMIYSERDDRLLAEKLAAKEEKEAAKEIDQAEKDRIWKLIVNASK